MFRRRRRRSRFASSASLPIGRAAMLGVSAVILVGGFVFFMMQANARAPAPAEMRIELPDAFKSSPTP